MPEEPAVIAQVRLARSTWRLLLVPAILASLGLLAIAVASLLGGGAGIAALAAGALAILVALLVGASLLSVRLEVDLAVLRLHWLGGERRYVLLRGPVTRIAVRGPSASPLRPRFGLLGWGLGAARLRNQEEIELIRLAPSRSVIAVPTDRGRLAIAPASEQELLAALAGAARVKQRLDEMTGRFGQRPPYPRRAGGGSPRGRRRSSPGSSGRSSRRGSRPSAPRALRRRQARCPRPRLPSRRRRSRYPRRYHDRRAPCGRGAARNGRAPAGWQPLPRDVRRVACC